MTRSLQPSIEVLTGTATPVATIEASGISARVFTNTGAMGFGFFSAFTVHNACHVIVFMRLSALLKWLAATLSLLLLHCTGNLTYRDSLRLNSNELNSLQKKAVNFHDGEAAWLLYLHYSTFPRKVSLAATWLDRAIKLRYPKALVFKESLEHAHIE